MKILKPSRRCHANLENMTDSDKGKFCHLCNKKVHDLAQYSVTELNIIIHENPDGFCGKIQHKNTSQLYYSLTKNDTNFWKDDGYQQKTTFTTFKLFKTTAVAASLFLASNTNAQQHPQIHNTTEKEVKPMVKDDATDPKTIILTGKTNLKNAQGVHLQLLTLEKVYNTSLDADGNFRLEVPHSALKINNLFSLDAVFEKEFFEVRKEDLKNIKFESKLETPNPNLSYGEILIEKPSPTSLIAVNGKFITDNKAIIKSLNLYSNHYTFYEIPKKHMHIFTKNTSYSSLFLIYLD